MNFNNLWVFEGNDGVGKTTTINNIIDKLEILDIHGVRIPFNMSELTIDAIKNGKRINYDVQTNSFLHLASLSDEISRNVYKELNKGNIVFLDRYVYTIIARAIARSHDYKWLSLVQFFPKINDEHLIFFDLDAQIALQRKKRLATDITKWESGEDLKEYSVFNDDERFIKFQTAIRKEYLSILPDNSLIIDSSQDQNIIEDLLLKKIFKSIDV